MLRQATEEDALAEVLAKWAPPQYAPVPSDQLPRETEAQFNSWKKVWKKLELRDLSGFSTFEAAVHTALHTRFNRLNAVFVHYAGARHSLSAGWAMKEASPVA